MPPVGGAPTAKRGSKACVACKSARADGLRLVEADALGRKGKNRCEGDQLGRARRADGVLPMDFNACLRSRPSAERVEHGKTV